MNSPKSTTSPPAWLDFFRAASHDCEFSQEAPTGKIPEVEAAKALMTEAIGWSVMKWLREKKRVRKAADEANAVLDKLAASTLERWPSDVKSAFAALDGESGRSKSAKTSGGGAIAAGTAQVVRSMKEADAEAYQARMDAEATFDEAEKKLSTSLAREGCRKAILSWELKEKAIRKAETMIPQK